MMENESMVRGFKVFNPDWTCRGFQYEVGKTYEMEGEPVCCSSGFHFCTKATDCFSYYGFDSENKVAEIIALGEVDYESSDTKCCTNKIKIVRELPWDEVLRIVNMGKDCTGFRNTGDYNTGNCNTGNCNTGNCNTGNCNTGNRNAGDYNTGDYNTGDYNTGDYNAGDYNTGNCNTGDWNKSSFNTGCFMTEEQKIPMFDKPSDWTYRDWLDSDARYLLNQIPKNVVEWVHSEDMTDKEKAEHPTHETANGYLKVLDESDCGQLWWGSLSDCQKNTIKALPNFEPEIFEKCTGIKIDCKS